MGCQASTLYKEASDFISKQVKRTLVDHSQLLQTQLNSIDNQENKLKLYSLVEIGIQQGKYFYDLIQNIFNKFNCQLPNQFESSNKNYLHQLQEILKQSGQQKDNSIIRTVQYINQSKYTQGLNLPFPRKSMIYNQQNKKVSPKNNPDEQLNHLNGIISKHQQNQKIFNKKILQLQESLQFWQKQCSKIKILNSQLYRKSFKNQDQKQINQIRTQNIRLTNQINKYKAIISSELKKKEAYQSQIIGLRLNQQQQKNKQDSYLKQLNKLSYQIQISQNSIKTLIDNKKLLQEQLQRVINNENKSKQQINKLTTTYFQQSKQIKSQLETAEFNVAETKLKLSKIEAEKKTYQLEIQKLQQKVNVSQRQLQNLTITHNNSITIYNQKLQKHQTQLAIKESQYVQKQRQYKKRITNLENKIKQLQQRLKNSSQFIDTQNNSYGQSSMLDVRRNNPGVQKNNYYDYQNSSGNNSNRLIKKSNQTSWMDTPLPLHTITPSPVVTPAPIQSSLPADIELINLLKSQKSQLQSQIKLNKDELSNLKSKITNLQQKISTLQEQLQASLQRYSLLKFQLQKKRTLLQAKQQQLQAKQFQLSLTKSQLLQKQNQLKQSQQKVQQHLKKIEQQSQIIRQKDEKLTKLQKELQIKQQQNLGNAGYIKEMYQSQLTQKNIIITEMKLKVNTLQKQLDEKNESLKQLTNKQNLSEQTVKKLQQQKSIIQNQLSAKIIQLQQKKAEYQIEQNKSIQANGKLRAKTVQLMNEIGGLKRQLKQVNNRLLTQKLQHDKLMRTQQQQKDRIAQEKNSLQQNCQKLQDEKQRLLQQINELNKNNTSLCQQIQIVKKISVSSKRCYGKYFNGYILSIDTPEDTQWVVNNIEKYLGREIRSTRMICKMDLQNKNNLHNYIDGIPNIVFIAKMQNGQIILAYSEPAFSKQMGNINYRPGIMLGLRNRKVFTVKREKTNKLNLTDPRPITWDEQYIIWGNTDLRLRMTSTEFYSNYATPNGSFEERGNSKKAEIQDLFMMGDRTTQVVDYEFYEVKFEGK